MKINLITLFPSFYENFFSLGIIKKAISLNKLYINIIDLRDFSFDGKGRVDDTPYGGGAGMIIRVDVLYNALKSVKEETHSLIMSASGKKYNQEKAKELSSKDNITIICPKYEGFDERIVDFVDEEISIGDYILSSGDIPALVIIDSLARQIDGVLQNKDSLKEESFNSNILEYPQYTKPLEFLDKSVPEILISGNHKKIKEYRDEIALKKTRKNRKDLLL